MKKKLLIFLILLTIKNLQAQQVDAYFNYAPFYIPGKGTFIETYLEITGTSVFYHLNKNKAYESNVEVTMVFRNADDIVEFRHYNVVSPPLPDTSSLFPNFIDLQRILIPQGVYNFELKVSDSLAPDSLKNDYSLKDIITVNIPENELAFSGIEFIERYTQSENKNIFMKNGYECIPYVSDYFPQEVNYLRFYMEIYNAATDLGGLGECLLLTRIENAQSKRALKDFSSFQKIKGLNVNVVFKEINIKNLPTGNYYLVVEIRDKENKTKGSVSKFFQRSNNVVAEKPLDIVQADLKVTFVRTFTNADSLSYLLSALHPICESTEIKYIENLQQTKNLQYMQQFFYSFWVKRDELSPENAWNEYYQKLLVVQQRFGNRQQSGFDTDRGRIYLTYGPPSSVIEEHNESDAFPYEIWHYYTIKDQSNKKFIFYNKDLAGNNYTLLHSNMAGETSDPNWESKLYSRTATVKSNKMSNKTKAKEQFEGL